MINNILTKIAIKLNKYLLDQKIKQLDEAPKEPIKDSPSIINTIVEEPKPTCTCGCNHEDNDEPLVIINVDLPSGDTLVLESYDICQDFVDLAIKSMVEAGELPEGNYEDVEFEVFVKDGEEDE